MTADGGPDRGLEPDAILLATDRVQEIAAVRGWLDDAAIPWRSGVMAGPPPRVVISVPASQLDAARRAVAAGRRQTEIDGEIDSADAWPAAGPPGPQPFPTKSVLMAAALVLVHLVLLPAPPQWMRWGMLAVGRTWHQPWRLLTSLFLHADVPHVLWNGVSMVVFAVPLLSELGYTRTALIYLAAGLGGGVTAVTFAAPGATIIGSSGAVAGLFGAWVVTALARARQEPLTWRARIRTIGLALLVLPSFLSPVTSTGRPVSIGSHVGGLITGMLIGAWLSQRITRHRPVPWSAPSPP